MDFIPLKTFSHYEECALIAEEFGFYLVELKITPQKGVVRVNAVIAGKDSAEIGVNDCAKVHRAILAKLEEVLNRKDIAMELSSPGMERNIKNAAEFCFFAGRKIRVWSRAESDWILGELVKADDKKIVLKIEENEKEIQISEIAKAKFVSS